MKIGVVGCGHWGPNHIRNLVQNPQIKEVKCADMDASRLKEMARLYLSVKGTAHYKDLVKDKEVDAIVVATPTETHYRLVEYSKTNHLSRIEDMEVT